MAAFNLSVLKPASKSVEFGDGKEARSAKDVLLAGIDNQLKLWRDSKLEGRRWFTAGKAEVAIQLRYQNKALVLIGNEKTVVCPVDQFEGAMAHFRKEVEADKYKDQLALLEQAGAGRLEKMRKTRSERKAAKEARPATEGEPKAS